MVSTAQLGCTDGRLSLSDGLRAAPHSGFAEGPPARQAESTGLLPRRFEGVTECQRCQPGARPWVQSQQKAF